MAPTTRDRRDDDDDRPPREPSPPRRPRDIRDKRRGGGRRRRVSWWIAGIALLVLFVLFSFGLDLWTDALWYRSVGFDAVFWTRIGAQAALFAAGLFGSLAILLLNLWLAGRLMPPPDETGAAARSARSWSGSTRPPPVGRSEPPPRRLALGRAGPARDHVRDRATSPISRPSPASPSPPSRRSSP